MVPMPVKSVEPLPVVSASARGPERVTISVQQPQRYSLFVTPGSEPTDSSCGIAVASSCAAPVPRTAWRLASPWSELPNGITIRTSWQRDTSAAPLYRTQCVPRTPRPHLPDLLRNTFIDIPSARGRSKERSHSEPPCLRGRSGRRRKASFDECMSESAGTLSSAARSFASSTSSGENEVFVGIHCSPNENPLMSHQLARSASLMELLDLWSKGYQSFGCRGHAQGGCWPCVMQHRFNHSDAGGDQRTRCKFGALCGRCHESHSRPQLNAAQKRVRRANLR